LATMGWRYLSGPVEVQTFPEDETAGSFNAGELVALSAGELIIAAGYVDLLGVAMKAATGTSATQIPVMIINPLQRWIGAAGTTTAVTQVGTQVQLTVTADAQSVSVASTTTDGGVVIERLDPRDGAHTGSGGRLIVRFATGACLMDGGGAG
jgi:hypothetical protein